MKDSDKPVKKLTKHGRPMPPIQKPKEKIPHPDYPGYFIEPESKRMYHGDREVRKSKKGDIYRIRINNKLTTIDMNKAKQRIDEILKK